MDYHPGANGLPLHHIRLDETGVIQEIEASHFRLLSQHEHTKGQYMAIFEKQ